MPKKKRELSEAEKILRQSKQEYIEKIWELLNSNLIDEAAVNYGLVLGMQEAEEKFREPILEVMAQNRSLQGKLLILEIDNKNLATLVEEIRAENSALKAEIALLKQGNYGD